MFPALGFAFSRISGKLESLGDCSPPILGYLRLNNWMQESFNMSFRGSAGSIRISCLSSITQPNEVIIMISFSFSALNLLLKSLFPSFFSFSHFLLFFPLASDCVSGCGVLKLSFSSVSIGLISTIWILFLIIFPPISFDCLRPTLVPFFDIDSIFNNVDNVLFLRECRCFKSFTLLPKPRIQDSVWLPKL